MNKILQIKPEEIAIQYQDDIEDLMESIRQLGWISGSIVIIKESDGDKPFEVFHGNRRVFAAQLLGLKIIPCMLVSEEYPND